MRFERTESFKADWRRLSDGERVRFRQVVPAFHRAAELGRDRPPQSWPAALRVKSVEGASGVWEMTWSFAGPDGRATFEWTTIDGDVAVRWRRIGGHNIFLEP